MLDLFRSMRSALAYARDANVLTVWRWDLATFTCGRCNHHMTAFQPQALADIMASHQGWCAAMHLGNPGDPEKRPADRLTFLLPQAGGSREPR